MSMTDPIANMLAAIKNGQMALKPFIIVPASKARKAVLQVLVNEGYINGISDAKNEDGHPVIKIDLKYFEGRGVINKLKKISTPGRRVHAPVSKFPKIYNGLGIIIVSTSKGVMSDFDARQANIGGELICSVF